VKVAEKPPGRRGIDANLLKISDEVCGFEVEADGADVLEAGERSAFL